MAKFENKCPDCGTKLYEGLRVFHINTSPYYSTYHCKGCDMLFDVDVKTRHILHGRQHLRFAGIDKEEINKILNEMEVK